jgi:RNA polymerase sigma-70 factor (ECF subfamily)
VTTLPRLAPSKIAQIEVHIPALGRYVSVLARGRQDRDDLVQNCLVRALTRLHTHRDESTLQSWLFTIMHNLFVSQWRYKKARARTTISGRISVDGYPLPPEREHQIEPRETLRALNKLAEEQQQVLVLIAIEDLSYAEVAQVLGIPLGTAMSRLSRGRERLRRTLEGAS